MNLFDLKAGFMKANFKSGLLLTPKLFFTLYTVYI